MHSSQQSLWHSKTAVYMVGEHTNEHGVCKRNEEDTRLEGLQNKMDDHTLYIAEETATLIGAMVGATVQTSDGAVAAELPRGLDAVSWNTIWAWLPT